MVYTNTYKNYGTLVKSHLIFIKQKEQIMNKHKKDEVSTIENLKRNDLPFGMLNDSCKKILREVRNLLYYSQSGCWEYTGYCPAFYANSVYRIPNDYKYEIEQELPPKPPQEWLDRKGVELTGECREPRVTDNAYASYSYQDIWRQGIDKLFATHPDIKNHYNGKRWILRKKAPKVIPWGRAEWERVGMVRGGYASNLVECVTDVHVQIQGYTYTHKEASEQYTQVDGKPCTKKVE
jgi:hypothetical protein